MDKDFTDAFFPGVQSDSEEHEAVEQNVAETAIEAVEAPEVKTEAETPKVEAPAEQPRNEKGQFANQQERPTIPVEALLEERNKRQEWERKFQEAEQKLRDAEAKTTAAARPDPFENPEGMWAEVDRLAAEKAQQAVVAYQQQQQANWFNQSAVKAEQEHGKEAVQAAVNWAGQRAQTDAEFRAQLQQQPDPMGWILDQQTRHAQFEDYLRDPEGFKARLLAEQSPAAATNVAAANKTQTAAAPKSVASMGSGSAPVKEVNQSDADFLNGFFSRRS